MGHAYVIVDKYPRKILMANDHAHERKKPNSAFANLEVGCSIKKIEKLAVKQFSVRRCIYLPTLSFIACV